MLNKAIFLDRDGVINEEIDLLCGKSDIVLCEGVKEALRLLKDRGFYLIVITNQPVIGRGLIDEGGIEELHKYLNSELDNLIDAFYFCPHHPNADLEEYRKTCDCRKPSPGMILKAAKDFDIDLKRSFMVGDMPSDITAGGKAGCKTVLMKSENNEKIIETGKKFDVEEPLYKIDNLLELMEIVND